MKRMPDGFVDLTVTSPPYDTLRKYNSVFDVNEVAKELLRATKQGGVCVWVVSDKTINGSESTTSFKQALAFVASGWNLHDTMIYASDKPPLNHNRYEQEFEFMFVFSKGKPKTFNPIMVECKYAGEDKSARTFRQTGDDIMETHQKTPVKSHKIKGNIWRYATGYNKSTKDKIAFKHPAIFPEQLAADHINTWSNEGDLVYDCFGGSCTTAKMSILLNRRWVVSELSQEYADLGAERIKPYQTITLFQNCA
jgi:site-specific DNA-methyltransferase (adenine-specific)